MVNISLTVVFAALFSDFPLIYLFSSGLDPRECRGIGEALTGPSTSPMWEDGIWC